MSRDEYIIEEYGNGFSLRELALEYSLSVEGVRKILLRNGVRMRKQGDRFPKIKKPVDCDTNAK